MSNITLSPPDYLYEHQKRAWSLAQENDCFCYFLEMGTGKTVISAAIISTEIQNNPDSKIFVIARNNNLYYPWMFELIRFAPNCKIVNLKQSTTNKINKAINTKSNIYLFNHHFALNKDRFKKLCDLKPNMVIIDESTILRDPKGKIRERIQAIGNLAKKRFILTGLPAPNSPLEFWGQINFVKPGLFSTNYYSFRREYGYQTGFEGKQWKVTNSDRELILNKIKPISMVVNKSDCLDLPDKIFELVYVEPDKEQAKYYEDMKESLSISIKNKDITTSNAISATAKLRQISSGFIYDENKLPYWFTDNKLKELEYLLEQIGNKQVVIWASFITEVNKICEFLTNKNIPFRQITGKTKYADREKNISDFLAGKVKYLITNPACLAYGTTLIRGPKNQISKYPEVSDAIYFSLDWKSLEFHQSLDRIHRDGQVLPTTYYAILTRNTMDHKIWYALKNKEKIQDIILKELKI